MKVVEAACERQKWLVLLTDSFTAIGVEGVC